MSGVRRIIRLLAMFLRDVVTRTSNGTHAPLIFGIALYTLVATGSVVETVGFAVVTGIHVWSGRRVIQRLAGQLREPFFVFGTGVLVATLLFTAFFQAFRTVWGGSALALVLLLTTGFFCRRQQSDAPIPLDWQFCLLFVAVLCRGLQGAYWVSAVACLGFAYHLSNRRLARLPGTSRRTIRFTIGVVGIALVVALRHIQSWWWFPTSNDASYFEALSTSLTQFGPTDHPGVAGGSVIGYHWFSYGWSGAVSDVANLLPWHSLAILTPFMMLLVGVSLIVALFVEFGVTPRTLLMVVVSVIALVSSATFTISAWFGNYWLLALILVVLIHLRRPDQGVPSVLLALLAVGAIFAKSTNLVPILLLLGLSVVALLAARRVRVAIRLGLPIVLASAMGYLYFSSGIGPQFVEKSSLLCGLPDLASCTAEGFGSNKKVVILAAILVVIGCAVGLKMKSIVLSLFAVFLGVGQLVVVVIFRPSDVPTYVTNSLSFLSTLAVGLVCATWMSRGLRDVDARLIVGSAAACFVGGFSMSSLEFVQRTTALDEKLPGFLDGLDRINQSSLVQGLSVAIGLFIVTYAFVFRRRDPLGFGLIVAVSILCFGVGQKIADDNSLYATGTENFVAAEENGSSMATDDLIEVAETVRKSTPTSYILSTNNFCCSGPNWLQEQLTSGGEWNPEIVARLGEGRYGGGNYLVQAFTQRRTLASGLRHVTTSVRSSESVIAKVNASLEFANAPTVIGMNTLCEMGANGAFINLALTQFDSWSGPGTVKAHVGDFVFVDFSACRQ